MFGPHAAHRQNLLRVLICLLTLWSTVFAQNPKQKDEVVRVYTELVQTDVMVFDKQGRFVDGLTRENFELRIDGKVRPIESFEQISAGSDEEAQLAAARGSTTVNTKRPVPLDRGRTVFFYIDDLHMDLPGLVATRQVINAFIDKEMGQNDQAALASASGQIGFLQQLTSDRTVLRAALARLNVRPSNVRDSDRPPMSEYEAILIDRPDITVLDFFVSETMRQNPGMNREMAASIVNTRAHVLLAQANNYTTNTLIGLDRLVRSVKELPGRKILFFLSNGFFIENRRSDNVSKLREVTTAAAKSGVVIYSMDTRGLVATLYDASSDRAFDPSGRLSTAASGELSAGQDPLNALAADTGGRALFNTNDLRKGLKPAINETSSYYLIAWKPDSEKQKQSRFRNIDVRIVGRPELSVRVRKGYFDSNPTTVAAANAPPKPEADTKTIVSKLRESISAPYPIRTLPIILGVDYLEVAGRGSVVSTGVQMPGEFLEFSQQPDGKVQAIVDVVGLYLDDKGKPQANFAERIVTTAPSLEASKNYSNDITYTYPANLKAGLYQVRVAVRDEKSGRTGSAHAWITIPDLTNNKLQMSSLILGESSPATPTNVSGLATPVPVALTPSHRFKRDSNLRFLVFTYNSKPAPADQKPDIAVQVQVTRDDQPVITTALRKIVTEGVADLTRLPYAAEIQLADLQPGRYQLHVTVIDRVSKSSASRETQFEIY